MSTCEDSIISLDFQEPEPAAKTVQDLNSALENRVADLTAQLRAEIITRKQMEREIKHRLRIEHTLAKISASFIQLQNFDHALDSTLRSLGQLVQGSRVGLYVSREYGAYFECTHEWCCPKTVSQIDQNRRISGDIFTRWIEDYQDVKALHVDDMSRLPPGYLSGVNRRTGEPARSLLLLPINSQSTLLGFLSIEDIPTPSYWRKEGLSLLGIVAQILGSGLERTNMTTALEQRVRDRTTELKVLYEVASLASKPMPVEEILRQSLEKLLQIRSRSVGFIQLLEENRMDLHLLLSRKIPEAVVRMAQSQPWQQFILHKVIIPNQVVVFPDLMAELGTDANDVLCGYNAATVVPVRNGSQARGVLVILGEQYIQLSAEQMTLVSAITDQVQIAVESAHLRRHAEETAIVDERQRLARELHDSVTQSLYSMSCLARGWQRGVEGASNDEIKQWFKRIGDISTNAMKEMRLLLYDLRPFTLQQDGLEGALRRRLDTVEGKLNVKTQLRIDRTLRLNSTMEQELYRIAQEALNNILKYSEASLVSVSLRGQSGSIELEVEDNGVGFDVLSLESSCGIGLVSMRERTEKLGGCFSVTSKPGEGTRVWVQVPDDACSKPSNVLNTIR